jgi:hypothetical protein
MSGGGQKATSTFYSGAQIQTTNASTPIPIVWGSNVLTPTCVWYGDFMSEKKRSKLAGKGGATGAVTGQHKETVYKASLIMPIAEGPITDIARCWPTSWAPIDLISAGFGLFYGNDPQAPWSYMTTNHPTEALGYNGIAYLAAYEYDLGPTASVGSTKFEVVGIFSHVNPVPIYDGATLAYIGTDADPALIIQDFLTNTQYGMEFPAESIATDTLIGYNGYSYQTYCAAIGFVMSPALVDQEAGNSILSRWLKLTNSTCVWTSGVLKFLPLADGPVTGNGYTWTPNTTALYLLTDEDFEDQGVDQDPVQVTRSDPYSIPNRLDLEICSRLDEYHTGPISVWDQTSIDRYGLRHGGSTSAHEICDVAVGQLSAQLILQRGLYIRRTFKFKLSWEFGLLDPMDIVEISDPALGLTSQVVRITDIEEDENGLLSITAEEYPGTVGTAVAYPVQANGNTGTPNFNYTAVAISAPVIFAPPTSLSLGVNQIWVAVSPSTTDPFWEGCYVWASLDGVTYAQVGTILGASTIGVTTASLPSYILANPDTTNTLHVSMAASHQPLSSTTAPHAAAGVTTCYVGGEYISYTTATLTGVDTYDLTSLYRGLDGVPSATIASGSPFVLLSDPLFTYSIPTTMIGQTIYLQFQSFNIGGAGLQPLTSCTVYTYP